MKPKLMIKDVLVRDTAASNIDDPACELRRGVQPADSGLRLESRKRETLAQLSYTELTRSLIHSFIGLEPATSRAGRGTRRARRPPERFGRYGDGTW